jgi:hypothetical protein
MDWLPFSYSRSRRPKDGSFGRFILAIEVKLEGSRGFPVAVDGRFSRDKFISGAVLRRVGFGGGGGGMFDLFSDGKSTTDVAALATVGTGCGSIAAFDGSAEAGASRILDAGEPDSGGEGAVAPSDSIVARVTLDLLVEADDVLDAMDSPTVAPLGAYEETVD